MFNKKYTNYIYCQACLKIFLLRKTGFNWIIKDYWYTKRIIKNDIDKNVHTQCEKRNPLIAQMIHLLFKGQYLKIGLSTRDFFYNFFVVYYLLSK